MKTERLQVLVDRAQRERLELAAASRGVSIASLVRTAIDAVYPSSDPERQRAASSILDARPMEVPTVAELVDELGELRARRE